MINKVLDLSTGHVSDSTRELLSNSPEGTLPFRHVSHIYGWIIFVGGPYEKENFTRFPELEAILNYAYEQDCMMINFDGDAELNEQFPTFEW